ncbi:TPA: hypothetical protein LC430_004925 [Salmonella enterica subsp. enterica serovar Duisburg]|nr:hypothetical protein [Salmonella enterica subsp. enterica serovar Duisburg]
MDSLRFFHKIHKNEVFLSYCACFNSEYKASAFLSEHHYYCDHIKPITDLMFILECARQAETYIVHKYEHQLVDTKFILTEWSCEFSESFAPIVDLQGKDITLKITTDNPRRTEAPIVPLIVAGMNRLGALSKNPDIKHASRPFDRNRDGFVIAEGAGFVVLETEEHAVARGQEILAFVSGAGTSTDAYHVTTPEPQGRGLSVAIQKALENAGLKGKDIQYVNAHGTSTRINDVTEGRVIEKEIGRHAPVTSLKGAIGHTLAAAGAVETVLTILSVKHGIIPPTANLISLDSEINLDVVCSEPRKLKIHHALKLSMGFGGHNGALIISANNKD